MATGRMLKASIRTSRTVNSLSDFQFRLWAYLITYVDDFGRGSSDPELLKGLVFPRRKGVTEKQIQEALSVLANTGMIALYEVDDESYLYFPKWEKHQRMRNKVSAYPAPPHVAASCGEMSLEVEDEVEVEVEDEVEENDNCAEQSIAPALTIKLNDGSDYPVTHEFVNQMQGCYQAVDVMQELRKMQAWAIANPKKRKTKAGITRFINAWLSKAQDQGGGPKQAGKSGRITTFMDL